MSSRLVQPTSKFILQVRNLKLGQEIQSTRLPNCRCPRLEKRVWFSGHTPFQTAPTPDPGQAAAGAILTSLWCPTSSFTSGRQMLVRSSSHHTYWKWRCSEENPSQVFHFRAGEHCLSEEGRGCLQGCIQMPLVLGGCQRRKVGEGGVRG